MVTNVKDLIYAHHLNSSEQDLNNKVKSLKGFAPRLIEADWKELAPQEVCDFYTHIQSIRLQLNQLSKTEKKVDEIALSILNSSSNAALLLIAQEIENKNPASVEDFLLDLSYPQRLYIVDKLDLFLDLPRLMASWIKEDGILVFTKDLTTGKTYATQMVYEKFKDKFVVDAVLKALEEQFAFVEGGDVLAHYREMQLTDDTETAVYFERLREKVSTRPYGYLDDQTIENRARIVQELYGDLNKKGWERLKDYLEDHLRIQLERDLTEEEKVAPESAFLLKITNNNTLSKFIQEQLLTLIEKKLHQTQDPATLGKFLERLFKHLNELQPTIHQSYLKKVFSLIEKRVFPEDVNAELIQEKNMLHHFYCNLATWSQHMHLMKKFEDSLVDPLFKSQMAEQRILWIEKVADLILNESIPLINKSDLFSILFQISSVELVDREVVLNPNESFTTSYWHDFNPESLKTYLEIWSDYCDHIDQCGWIIEKLPTIDTLPEEIQAEFYHSLRDLIQ